MLQRFLISAALLLCCSVGLAQGGSEKPLLVEQCWDHPTGEVAIASIAVDADNVFAALGNGTIKALGLRDGRDRWSTELGGTISSNIIVLADRVLVVTASVEANGAGSQTSTLRALSKETGLTLYSVKLAGAEKTYLAELGGTIAVVSSTGSISGLGIDGTPRWNFALSSSLVAAPITVDGGIIVALADRSIQRIRAANGETIAKQNGASVATALGSAGPDEDGRIYIGDERGSLFSSGARSGDVDWRFKTGGRVQHIVAGAERVYAASVDNFVYAISPDKGSVVWKKRLPSRVDGRPLLWRSVLVLSSFGESSSAIVDAKDGRTLKTIDFGNGNVRVGVPVLGDDGNLILPLQSGLRAVGLGGCQK